VAVTLITDGFADDPQVSKEPVPSHSIVYGAEGWTDALDDTTIDLLVEVGAIGLDRVHSGPGWETRIYVSRCGVLK
jgi:hypothetical protein